MKMDARLAIVLMLAVAGCSDPVGGCDPCRTTAVVFGDVRDANGSPIGSIKLHILSYLMPCPASLFRGGESPYTDAAGHYRTLVSSLYSPHTAQCIRVFLDPSTTAGTGTDTLEFPVTLEFRIDDDRTARDSIRLDLVFPDAPS